MPDDQYPYINTTTAARLMGTSATYVRRLCRLGRLPRAIKPARDWLVHVDDVATVVGRRAMRRAAA